MVKKIWGGKEKIKEMNGNKGRREKLRGIRREREARESMEWGWERRELIK